MSPFRDPVLSRALTALLRSQSLDHLSQEFPASAPLPILGSPEARVFGLLLRSQSLDHLRPEFSASFADDGLDAPPVLCSKIGAIWPIPLCGLSSL